MIRVADARPVQLGHAATADGRWRLYLFADASERALRGLCTWLETSPDSPILAYQTPDDDIDTLIDVRAILQQRHREVATGDLPSLLAPRKGRYQLTDHEKVFATGPEVGPDIFTERGINRDRGCMVLVRPDQYISQVLDLRDRARLAGFFNAIMRTPATLDR